MSANRGKSGNQFYECHGAVPGFVAFRPYEALRLTKYTNTYLKCALWYGRLRLADNDDELPRFHISQTSLNYGSDGQWLRDRANPMYESYHRSPNLNTSRNKETAVHRRNEDGVKHCKRVGRRLSSP